MKELVEYLAKGLVGEPDDVEVREVESGHTIVYEIMVAQRDLGKVIGRGGRIAEALRTIVKAVPTTDGRRCTVEIVS